MISVSFRNTANGDALAFVTTSFVSDMAIARANDGAEKGRYSQIVPVPYDKKFTLKVAVTKFLALEIEGKAYRRIGSNT